MSNDLPFPAFRRAGQSRQGQLRTSAKQTANTAWRWQDAVIWCMALSLVAGLMAGTYALVRDDLLKVALKRHLQIQHAYEDRLANLRAQVDIVTSRQLLDQQQVERRVQKLLARQSRLNERQQHVQDALRRAARSRVLQQGGEVAPVAPAADKDASLTTGSVNVAGLSGLRLNSFGSVAVPATGAPDVAVALAQTTAGRKDSTFVAVERSLVQTEGEQIALLSNAAQSAAEKADALADILEGKGIGVAGADTGIGGPLVAVQSGDAFLRHIDMVDAALARLAHLRNAVRHLPHGSPVPGKPISSRFGVRKDPFTGRKAMHGGLDFRARTGVKVQATAAGTVIHSGRKGGYGLLVEIDHGNGITTRYAHLSRILVKRGQKVRRGAPIGKVGSTGRSTGPHLHYEVRRGDNARNPLPYLKLADRIRPLL